MKQNVILASLAAMLTVSACGEQNKGTAVATTEKETGMQSDMVAGDAMKSDAQSDPSNPYMASETGMHDKMMAAFRNPFYDVERLQSWRMRKSHMKKA